MRRVYYFVAVVTVAAAVLASSVGCASWGDKQKKGTGIGAAGGGVVGAVIGHKTGSTARGAIIGTVVGGALVPSSGTAWTSRRRSWLRSSKPLRSHAWARGSRSPSTRGSFASNDTDGGRQDNRRVEVAVYANGEWQAEAKRTSSLR